MEKVYLVFEEIYISDEYTEDVLVGVYAFKDTAQKVCDVSDRVCKIIECQIQY